MTNEQAIDRLRKISEKTPIRTNGDDLVAITMAIQAMLENEELSKDLDEALKEIDGYERGLSQEPTEKHMCDRNICISNEYNGIRCDECIVNKVEQEPYICDTCKHKGAGWDTEPCDGCCGNHSGYEPCERKNHEEKPHSLLDAYFQMRFESCAEQEPCDDEYIKVPKKALKYRTAGMIAYNAEWLKNHFDIERVVICGAQEPCDDAISREAVLDYLKANVDDFPDYHEAIEKVLQLPPIGMRDEMVTAYAKDEDFRRYVDCCMESYNKTFDEVLKLKITESYYRSLQKGECNERRQHE